MVDRKGETNTESQSSAVCLGGWSQTSQVLPVDGNQRLIGLLSVADDLSDAVLTPQTLDLPVTLGAQVEGVPPPADTHTHR